MRNLFHKLIGTISSGRDVVIVSVTASSGSVPRGTGAKMLVTTMGRIFGTVGGGAIEYEAERLGKIMLKERRCGTHKYKLAPNQSKDLGMVCGGNITLYFQYLAGSTFDTMKFCEEALDKINNGEECWLVTDISDGSNGKMELSGRKSNFTSRAQIISENDRQYLIEPLVNAGTLYIFGGGHIAQELVPIASKAEFRCVVLDDRAEFTDERIFPDALACEIVDFTDISKTVSITSDDYIVIMTRGHEHDAALQAQAMRTNARYIGVMGSQSKIAHVSAKMRALGFTDSDLARVKTPIGIPIQSETPAEIAISIAAELVMERAKRKIK